MKRLTVWLSVLVATVMFSGCAGHRYAGYSSCDSLGCATPIASSCDSCDGAGCGACGIALNPLQHLHNLRCGDGCGEVYWGEWLSDPPDCVDPCDDCGFFNGQSFGQCRTRGLWKGIHHLWGHRIGDSCGCSDCTTAGHEVIYSEEIEQVTPANSNSSPQKLRPPTVPPESDGRTVSILNAVPKRVSHPTTRSASTASTSTASASKVYYSRSPLTARPGR